MNALSRRQFICSAAAVAGAASLPIATATAGMVATPWMDKPLPAWIVGTPGEFDWQIYRSATEEGAKQKAFAEWARWPAECETPGNKDCACEYCDWMRGKESERVEEFDSIADPTSGDWITAGKGHVCARCSYETSPQEDGSNVNGDAVCADCMTISDWEIVDPERAAELRADA